MVTQSTKEKKQRAGVDRGRDGRSIDQLSPRRGRHARVVSFVPDLTRQQVRGRMVHSTRWSLLHLLQVNKFPCFNSLDIQKVL
jgi:hypothetical protein